MKTHTIHEAKTNLSKLIQESLRGEEVIIARGDKPVVKLVPIAAASKTRSAKAGTIRGTDFVDRTMRLTRSPTKRCGSWGSSESAHRQPCTAVVVEPCDAKLSGGFERTEQHQTTVFMCQLRSHGNLSIKMNLGKLDARDLYFEPALGFSQRKACCDWRYRPIMRVRAGHAAASPLATHSIACWSHKHRRTNSRW